MRMQRKLKAYKIDEDETDAEDANEIDDGKTEEVPEEDGEIQTPFFDLEGSTKKKRTATWVVTLVQQQFLRKE